MRIAFAPGTLQAAPDSFPKRGEQHLGRFLVRAPRKPSLAHEAESVREVVEVQTEYIHRTNELLGRHLPLTRLNRRQRLPVLEAELLRELRLRQSCLLARFLESLVEGIVS